MTQYALQLIEYNEDGSFRMKADGGFACAVNLQTDSDNAIIVRAEVDRAQKILANELVRHLEAKNLPVLLQ